jgi:hypothetical protein
VAFAGEAENKVHTYLVPQDQNSASDSGTYETRDDEEDDETDGDTLEENTLEDGDTIDNYTLDDATYGESTLGGGTIETGYTGNNTEGDIDILDHVDKAVAVIGSALGSFFLPKDQAPNSSTSIENDETIQNSTMGGSMEEEANAKGAGKSEYDWMGYMEKFLFPQDGVSFEKDCLLASLCVQLIIFFIFRNIRRTEILATLQLCKNQQCVVPVLVLVLPTQEKKGRTVMIICYSKRWPRPKRFITSMVYNLMNCRTLMS